VLPIDQLIQSVTVFVKQMYPKSVEMEFFVSPLIPQVNVSRLESRRQAERKEAEERRKQEREEEREEDEKLTEYFFLQQRFTEIRNVNVRQNSEAPHNPKAYLISIEVLPLAISEFFAELSQRESGDSVLLEVSHFRARGDLYLMSVPKQWYRWCFVNENDSFVGTEEEAEVEGEAAKEEEIDLRGRSERIRNNSSDEESQDPLMICYETQSNM
jgi:hypothetical protein